MLASMTSVQLYNYLADQKTWMCCGSVIHQRMAIRRVIGIQRELAWRNVPLKQKEVK